MTDSAIRRVDGYRDMLEAAGDHRVLLEQDAAPHLFHAGWTTPGAIAFAAPDRDAPRSGPRLWLNAVGPDDDAVATLVETAMTDCPGVVLGVTTPRSVPLEPWLAGSGTAWDLMVCDAPPPKQRAEEAVEDLAGPESAEQVQRFLDRVNAHHSVRADDPDAELWCGARDEATGVLLAVGTLTRRPSGVGYLASIATDQLARGRGLGSAVTARLTRRAFEDGDAFCTLAHYHPNEAARSIYVALGYRTTHRLHSGVVVDR